MRSLPSKCHLMICPGGMFWGTACKSARCVGMRVFSAGRHVAAAYAAPRQKPRIAAERKMTFLSISRLQWKAGTTWVFPFPMSLGKYGYIHPRELSLLFHVSTWCSFIEGFFSGRCSDAFALLRDYFVQLLIADLFTTPNRPIVYHYGRWM